MTETCWYTAQIPVPGTTNGLEVVCTPLLTTDSTFRYGSLQNDSLTVLILFSSSGPPSFDGVESYDPHAFRTHVQCTKLNAT